MRKLLLIAVIAVQITACGTKQKNKDGIGEAVDTSTMVMPNSNTQPVQGTLKVNTCFVNSSNTLTYLTNDNYCYFTSKICPYTYDKVNNIIAINYAGIWSDRTDDIVYYEIESGYDVKDRGYQMGINVGEVERLYDLNGNIDNPCYALVQMDKLSEGSYQLSRSGDRFSFYKPLNVSEVLNDYSYVMDGLKQTVNSYSQNFLASESKMFQIDDRGEESVDAALSNRVDETYGSISANWKRISKAKSKIDNYISTHQQLSSSASYTPSMFNELIANMEAFKNLIVENEQFNQSLNNDVLPLLQASK